MTECEILDFHFGMHDAGDKKISVPPRSPQSLESALTASYVTPDELFVLKSSCKL